MAKKKLEIVNATDANLKLVRDEDGTDTSLSLANEGNGAKVTGDLTVTGDIDVKGGVSVPLDKKIKAGNHSIADASILTEFKYHDNSYMKIATSDIYSPTELTLSAGRVATNGSHFLKEEASADIDQAGYGQVWVKNDAPNNLYFTDDTGQDVQITNNGSLAASGGGTSRWSHSWGGYKTSNSSSTIYYFQYYPNNNVWNNSESSPTSIGYFDVYAAEWIAPADGTLTKIDVFVRGGSDDCQFYVFKGTPSSANSSLSLTQIGASGACGITTSTKTFYKSATISSSNTFSAGDGLYIMMKKESHSISTHFYFSGTISGEYS